MKKRGRKRSVSRDMSVPKFGISNPMKQRQLAMKKAVMSPNKTRSIFS